VRPEISVFPRSAGRFCDQLSSESTKANREGWFAWEITPLAVKAGKEQKFIEIDEQPFKANLDKIPTLKPAFRKDGTVTAANSSSISDGAAALVLMRRSTAERRGLAPLALIAGHTTHAGAAVGAGRRMALERTRLTRARHLVRGVRRVTHGGDEDYG